MRSFFLGIIWILSLGTLIPLFLFWRIKLLRYVLAVLAILLFGYLGAIEVKHWNFIKENELRIVGAYQIDTLFQGQTERIAVKIILRSDNTFEISRRDFVLNDSVGTWEYFDDGELAFLKFVTQESDEMGFDWGDEGIVVKGTKFYRVK